MSEIIPKKPLSFGLFATKPHKRWAISAIVSVFIATGLDNSLMIVLKNLTDAIASPRLNFNTIWVWAIAWPVLYLIAESMWRMSGFTGMRWFMGFRSTAYQSLFEYLSLHSKEYFNSRLVGSLVNKISNAVDGCEYLLERMLWKFLPIFVAIFWYSIFAGTSNLKLGVIILGWSVIFIIVNIYFAKKLQPYSVAFADSQSTLKGRFVDSLANIAVVHEYANLSQEHQYIKKFIDHQYKTGLKNWWVSEWILVANVAMIFIFLLLMVGLSVYFFQQHLVSVGVVVMTVSIAGSLSWQLFFIGQELKDAAAFYGQTQEGLSEILTSHLITGSPNASPLKVVAGNIFFKNVDFSYEKMKVFDNFSINISAGQKVGLVGRSGVGKTTFVALLLRHFDVQKGSITIDGQNIKDVTLESLRRTIAFVPQDTTLFHRTIFENIAYGSPKASREKIMQAAELAQAHGFIAQLSKGYDTLVGERGIKLSGGQRQRIAIARAFLKKAPILVLDEATSSLDSESEQAIQISLDKLFKRKTVIAIAHRLSTLRKMDRIVVVDEGKIVEDGEPSLLLQNPNGIFKNMWDNQVKGFILDEPEQSE